MRTATVIGMAGILLGGGVEAEQARGPRPDGDEKVIIDQNLFHPSRSVSAPPPAPKASHAPVEKPSPPPPAPKFVLSGVVIDGEARMAILQEPSLTENKPRLVSPGQLLGPYRLTTVRPDRVSLLGPVGEVVVLLHDPQKPKPSPLARASVPSVQTEGEPKPTIQVPRNDPRRKQGFNLKSLLDAERQGVQPQAESPAPGNQ